MLPSFPGMNPFIESAGLWGDFHGTFIPALRNAIRIALPRGYVARMEERLCLTEHEETRRRQFRPDVTIHYEPRHETESAVQAGGVLLEPEVIPVVIEEESRETFIEIYRLDDERLVTVVELLSISNKDSRDRSQYLLKRNSILRKLDVSLVEIDLLLGGERLPMARPLPPAHYYAIVSRAERRPDCDVYHWMVDQPLPLLPVPLAPPDPDVRVDLQAVLGRTLEEGDYDFSIRYDWPEHFPVVPGYEDWVRQRVAAQ